MKKRSDNKYKFNKNDKLKKFNNKFNDGKAVKPSSNNKRAFNNSKKNFSYDNIKKEKLSYKERKALKKEKINKNIEESDWSDQSSITESDNFSSYNSEIKDEKEKDTTNSEFEKIYKTKDCEQKLKILLENFSTSDFDKELKFLDEMTNKPDYNLGLSIFVVENLAKRITPKNCSKFYTTILNRMIHPKTLYKNCIYKLKLLSIINEIKYFLPISYYCIEMIKQAEKNVPEDKTHIEFDLDMIKIDANYTKSESYQIFVIEQCVSLLMYHLNKISNTIGFPEVVDIILNEIGGNEFDIVDEFILCIKKQAKKIKKARKDIKNLNKDEMVEFEAGIELMLE